MLKGLSGAQDAFVLNAVFKQLDVPHVVIALDREEAAYTQNNIAAVSDKEDVLLFPDSFRRPMHFEEINRNFVLQRTESVNRFFNTATKGSVLVTYPEALFEKVVVPDVLQKTAINLAIGEPIEVDFLVEVLVEYGFERVDFVYEPGQFAIRGGIVDIYSYGNEMPYRVELFDVEVESIRTFNPGTQLSERKISRVTIVPNINTRFNTEEKASLLSLLPENTIFWIQDLNFLTDKLQDCFDRALDYMDKVSSLLEEDRNEEAKFLEDRAFLRPGQVMEELKSYSSIEINTDSGFKNATYIQFNGIPQPSFNKNFEYLIRHLSEHNASGIENYIFAENPKQVQRFYSIFDDLKADVRWHPIPKAINEGFLDKDLNIACYTDHQIFERYHRYKMRAGFDKAESLNLRRLRELRPGDFVTHLDHGVGRYSGLEKITINGQIQEAVRLIYRDNDVLYVSINSLHKISRYVGKDGTPPKIHKLGSDTWSNTKRRTKAKIKELAIDLIKLYAKRKATPGFAYSMDGYLQNELEASFIYEDTPDQAKATEDVKKDMQKNHPMDRLICGDVGFGKTEVAIRAAFKAVTDGKQVAILVPTTILAIQHARTFKERLGHFGVSIDYVNRFRSAKEKTEIFKQTEAGKVDILIGTHSILGSKVKFKDLGLLIIDEEQKFGVGAKEKLREARVSIDTLTLTATPIPRTLQFSLMAARDLSIINTPPPNRQPIQTEVRTFNDEVIKDAIYYEVSRGGQVFFIHNRVTQLPEMAAMLRRLCPDLDIAMAHGQMESDDLENVLIDFIDGKHDVLCSTNIIETGLDIPNANTIIINNANQFGLSDLHQLRGRVGRSNKKAFCYLFSPPKSVLTPEARKRLQVIEEFSDLGSGFHIAMRDLDIRGAGNLLGAEQSGVIADIGYETYQKILNEAIRELKETDFKDLFQDELSLQTEFVQDVAIETDIEMLIPDAYVSNIQERLNLYTELDDTENEAQLQQFSQSLIDRFGKLPVQVEELFEGLRLRWSAKKLGFERIILKGGKLRCYFISDPQSSFFETDKFGKIMAYMNTLKGDRYSLKQTGNYLMLSIDKVRSLTQAGKILLEFVGVVEAPQA